MQVLRRLGTWAVGLFDDVIADSVRYVQNRKGRPQMEIKRSSSQPSRATLLFRSPSAARVSGAGVTFEPGARTFWHTQLLDRMLTITSGVGWVQRDGGPIEEVRRCGVISARVRSSGMAPHAI